MFLSFSVLPAKAQFTEAWSKSYTSGSATDLVVDAQGNTYVTGKISSGGIGSDYGTIKYDPQGNQLWVKTYSGSGLDYAVAIALDGQGNVYVTGYSQAGNSNDDYDYGTIKYDPQGNQLWVKRYSSNVNPNYLRDQPSDLAVNSQGNVYITGTSIVVYDTQGNLLWHIPGINNVDLFFTSRNNIALDKQGNVYVTNVSTTTKYNAQGILQWQKQHEAYSNGIKTDEQGNVYVIGTSTYFDRWDDIKYRYNTMKYDAQGNLLWNKQEEGGFSFVGFDFQAKDLVVDGQGNVYITGEYVTVKYDAQGNRLWKKILTSVNGTSIHLTSRGDVYVTGKEGIIKYNFQGDQLWIKLVSGYSSSSELSHVSFLDTKDNLYLTGTSQTADYTPYTPSYLTKKFTPETIACSATGSILREYWANVAGIDVNTIPVNTAPTSSTQLTSFEAPSNVGNNYGQRIRGYICVPQSGTYTFYIAGDDNGELYLSTDDSPANKTKIAYLTGANRWTAAQQWTKFATQKSAAFTLQAGKKYYIEALHKEGLYSDYFAVGWQTSPASPITVIPGSALSPYVPQAVATGKITREYWANVTGSLVSEIPVNTTPTSVSEITTFETPSNAGNNYGQRIRGYVHPQMSGSYRFYIAGDDRCELWISTDEDPTKKTKIASVPYFSAVREWNKYSAQQSAVISLQAGKKYYIEALHKEGLYGDNLAVGWLTPGQTSVAVIAGTYLSPFLPAPSASIARVGVEESTADQVSLYPNPFEDKLTLTHTQAGKVYISIVDNLGRIVYQGTQSAGKNQLSLTHLKAGIYLIKVSSEDGKTQVLKAVKK